MHAIAHHVDQRVASVRIADVDLGVEAPSTPPDDDDTRAVEGRDRSGCGENRIAR